MALINSWIINKHVYNSSKSLRAFKHEIWRRNWLPGETPKEGPQNQSNVAVAECTPVPKHAKTVLAKTAETE